MIGAGLLRRGAPALLVLAVLTGGPGAGEAGAHAGLVRSAPAAGATLGAAPGTVRLTFSERPEPSLSDVTVLDRSGRAREAGPPAVVPGDASSLQVLTAKLPRGVYTVTFRSLSAVDGHATSGSFAFGVGEQPTGAAARTSASASPGGSGFEVLARFALIAGLMILLGAAVAGVAGFAGPGASGLRLAAGGWLLAAIGLAGLLDAQRRSAGAPIGDLLGSDVGAALIQRAAALAAAGIALLAAWRASSPLPPARARRHTGRGEPALAAASIAAAAAMLAHVAAGHAAAGSWSRAVGVGAQWAHFAAAAVWIGGLAALLLGVRGTPPGETTAAVRRFAIVALGGIVVVAAAGTLRAIDELGAVSELWSTGYGRAILAKIALLVLIAAIAARRRRHSGGRTRPGPPGGGRPAVGAEGLGSLRRTARAELVLAAGAIALAAVLGTIAPPVAGDSASRGLTTSGADFATTTRVTLVTASVEPGPNSFVARVTDYDSADPVRGARVRLRFGPLDDPGVDATSLALAARPGGSYAGVGANLAFDGRWRVTALVQRARDAVEVPLELDVPGPVRSVSIARIPGRPTTYTAQLIGLGYVRIAPDPERAGPSTLLVDVFTIFVDPARVDSVVVTAAAGSGRPRSLSVRRRGAGRFAVRASLARGANTVVVVARTADGTRLRAAFHLDIPG